MNGKDNLPHVLVFVYHCCLSYLKVLGRAQSVSETGDLHGKLSVCVCVCVSSRLILKVNKKRERLQGKNELSSQAWFVACKYAIHVCKVAMERNTIIMYSIYFQNLLFSMGNNC